MSLSVEGLRFAYPRGEELFGGLTHTFTEGSMCALTGPSGRGKSTLLYVLGLLLRPGAGSVLLRGVDVSHTSDAERSAARAHNLGFVFQDAALDQARPIIDSVVEPALYAGWDRKTARTRALELLTDVGVADRAHHRPTQISGGQAQRVAVARALINDPSVILADEPTGNLDSKTGEEVINLLKQLQDDLNITIITATHDVKMLNISDRIAWIRDGKLDRLEERANVQIDTGSIGE